MYFIFIILMITEKSPKQPRHKKIWRKHRTEVLEFIIETYMVKATICLIQSYLLWIIFILFYGILIHEYLKCT